MEFDQQMADIPVYVSCKFEIYIFEIAQVIGENVPIAFLYVLSISYLKIWRYFENKYIIVIFFLFNLVRPSIYSSIDDE